MNRFLKSAEFPSCLKIIQNVPEKNFKAFLQSLYCDCKVQNLKAYLRCLKLILYVSLLSSLIIKEARKLRRSNAKLSRHWIYYVQSFCSVYNFMQWRFSKSRFFEVSKPIRPSSSCIFNLSVITWRLRLILSNHIITIPKPQRKIGSFIEQQRTKKYVSR